MKRFTLATYLLAATGFALIACTAIPDPATAPALPVTGASSLAAAPTQTPDEPIAVSFKTPEEAITYYMDGLVQNDISKILQACAITEIGENFDFDFYTERLGQVISPNSLAPSDYPMYAEMNKFYWTAQILNKVKFFAYSLLSGENIDGSLLVLDEERIDRFIQNVDPSRLATIEIEQIALPNEAIMSEARYQETAAANARAFGADDFTERVILFSFEEGHYYMGFTLLRYGENWKISDPVSALANTSVLGVPEITTVEEFESKWQRE